MPALPEGVLTLFFSDIEGSTRLAKSYGDAAWAELLETHRRLLRQAFAAHGGVEVDTQGDSFFVVFRMASDAVAAALAAQRSLAAQAWPSAGAVRVRIALHTGEAIARGDHYVGQEIHRASRICDAGHGGQIVVSQTTAELVSGSLPEGATLTPLGDYRLKDLGQAQRLFQLCATGLASDFPRLRSLDIPTNLPTERSSFIGRAADISAIRERLAAHRLVTLTGIGGSGKTRLALQVAALELGHFTDGVFFVDLSPVSDAQLLASTVASACGLMLGEASGAGVASFENRLIAALARRKSLVIVDNCEHMVEAVADLLDHILADCASMTLLATSREALTVEGEQVVPVASLPLPDEEVLTQTQAESSDAVRLFVERAKAVNPSFSMRQENWKPVVELCRRLDGIPLAIEFAAARVAHLSVQQITERLQDRFALLTGGRRRIQRQQTLSATLGWSHDLLSDDERIVFRRLAVFAGGFALDAVEGVCSGEGLTKSAVLDLLASLVAKSLVTMVEDRRCRARYGLLETVRIYGLEKLAAANEAETLRSRHSDWYLAWIESIPLVRLTFSSEALDDIACEFDNLRAIAAWYLTTDRPTQLASLATRMTGFWFLGSFGLEGYRWLQSAIAAGGAQLAPTPRAACETVLAIITRINLDNSSAYQHSVRAIELSKGQSNPFVLNAFACRSFAQAIRATVPGADPGLDAAARDDANRAVALAVAGANLEAAWRASAELNFASVEIILGDMKAATQWYSRVMETCRQVKDADWLVQSALAGQAVTLHLMGQVDGALRKAMEFLSSHSSRGSELAHVRALTIEITPALIAAGRGDLARQLLHDGERDVRRLGIPMAETHFLCVVALVEFLRGHVERAGQLLTASHNLSNVGGQSIPFRSPSQWAFFRHYQPLVRAALGPEQWRRSRVEGQTMSIDEALAYAVEGLR